VCACLPESEKECSPLPDGGKRECVCVCSRVPDGERVCVCVSWSGGMVCVSAAVAKSVCVCDS
jgi:hypothetical protein